MFCDAALVATLARDGAMWRMRLRVPDRETICGADHRSSSDPSSSDQLPMFQQGRGGHVWLFRAADASREVSAAVPGALSGCAGVAADGSLLCAWVDCSHRVRDRIQATGIGQTGDPWRRTAASHHSQRPKIRVSAGCATRA
jgi:hypothetical protein